MSIASPRSYLGTITTRTSIDHLRRARARREKYVGEWLPEPVLEEPLASPTAHAETADSLSSAFLVLLETLSPVQRAVSRFRTSSTTTMASLPPSSVRASRTAVSLVATGARRWLMSVSRASSPARATRRTRKTLLRRGRERRHEGSLALLRCRRGGIGDSGGGKPHPGPADLRDRRVLRGYSQLPSHRRHGLLPPLTDLLPR